MLGQGQRKQEASSQLEHGILLHVMVSIRAGVLNPHISGSLNMCSIESRRAKAGGNKISNATFILTCQLPKNVGGPFPPSPYLGAEWCSGGVKMGWSFKRLRTPFTNRVRHYRKQPYPTNTGTMTATPTATPLVVISDGMEIWVALLVFHCFNTCSFLG